MSEKFLLSPVSFLERIAKEMRNRLDNYPMLAIKAEKIDYFYEKLKVLFTGGYNSSMFPIKLLHFCVMQFCEYVFVFIRDNPNLNRHSIDDIKRWIDVLNNIGDLESIQNKFTFFMPIIQNKMLEELPNWFNKEFLFILNRMFENPAKLIFHKNDKQIFLCTVVKWLQLLISCGDYEYQIILVEIIINTCEEQDIEEVFTRWSSHLSSFKDMFIKLHSQIDYVNDLKELLIGINDIYRKVYSVPCLTVTLEETVIPPLKDMNGSARWMHLNYGFQTLSFNCQRDSLRSLPGSQTFSNIVEFVTIHFQDIGKIRLMIYTDSKTTNTAGGIFLMHLTSQSSCRYESSKEKVHSIKKIKFAISDGLHLQFLKTEFTKIFGERFKEDSQIPKRKILTEEKNSTLNLSSHNLSFNVKNRRRINKHNDSIMSTPGNLHFENLLNLENKENLSQYSPDCFIISTGPRCSSTPVVNKKYETKNLQIEEHKIMNHNLRNMTLSSSSDLMPENSQGASGVVKKNLLPKVDLKNKENVEYLNEPPYKKKVLKSKKARRTRGNTKRNILMLKNSEVDILTTSKNNKTISSLTTKEKENEEIEIPSNYKFGEEYSFTILDDNQSSITELNTIPDLQSPSLLKNKYRKKISKVKNDKQYNNTSIDSNSMIAISKDKNDGLDLDVNLAASASNASQFNLLETTTNEVIDSVESVYNLPNIENKEVKELRKNASSMKFKMPDSYTLQDTEEIITGGKKLCRNKNLMLQTNINSYPLENTEVINEKVIDSEMMTGKENINDNLEIFKDRQILEPTECLSIIPDDALINDNKESNQMKNKDSKASDFNFGRYNTFKRLLNMNSEDIANVEVINVKENVNDNLLMLDNEIVNVGESEYSSINPDVTPIDDNSATPDFCFKNTYKKTKSPKTHPLKELLEMNSEEIINISVESNQKIFKDEVNKYYSINPDDVPIANNSETPDLDFNNSELKKLIKFDHSKNVQEENESNHFLLSEHEREYYSFDLNINSSENNKKYDGIHNSETPEINFNSNASIATPNLDSNNWKIFSTHSLTKINEEVSSLKQQNTLEQLIENENLELTVQQVNPAKESEYLLNAPDYQVNENSETPELDFILDSSINIVSPHVYGKNEKTKISTADCNELNKRDSDVFCQFSDNAPKVSNITDDFNGLKKTSQYLPTKKLQLNKVNSSQKESPHLVYSSKNVLLDDFETFFCRNRDSQSQETDLNIIKNVDVNTELNDNTTGTHFDSSIVEEKIENKSNEDVQKIQISVINHISEEIIPDVSEKQVETYDHIIISTSPTDDSVRDAELDGRATGIHSKVKNIASDIEQSSFVKEIEITVQSDDITNADMKKIQIFEINKSVSHDHCYSSDLGQYEIGNKSNKNDVDNFNNSNSGFDSVNDILLQSASKETSTDFELIQLGDVPIFDKILKNDVVALNKTNSDVSLTCLSSKHQETLEICSTNIENLKDLSMKSTSKEHISSNVSCDEQNEAVARKKVNILSNIRIVPPLYNKFNQSHNDVQLLKDSQKNKSEIARVDAELLRVTQTFEALERKCTDVFELINNFITSEACKKKKSSVTLEKRKLTQKDKIFKSKNNSEISKENEEIKSLQNLTEPTHYSLPDNAFLLRKFITNRRNLKADEIIEISDDEIDDDFKELKKTPRYLPTKKLLLNKFNTSQNEDSKSQKSASSLSYYQEFESFLSKEFLETKKKLSQDGTSSVVATNKNKNTIQTSKEIAYHQEFESLLPKKFPNTKKQLEYFSIIPDDALINDNKESNQMKINDSKASDLNFGENNTSMNSEEIGNLEVTESNFEILLARNEDSKCQEMELSPVILSHKMPFFNAVATNKNTMQTFKEISYHQEFESFLSKKFPEEMTPTLQQSNKRLSDTVLPHLL